MLFSTVTRVLGVLAITVSGVNAAQALDKDVYMNNIALGMLARINGYRDSHTNLNDAQLSALDLMSTVVAEYKLSLFDEAEEACLSAFGREECRLHFASHQAAGDSDLEKRADDCGCATLNDRWCDGGKSCALRVGNSCEYSSVGCGGLLIYPCDGQCH